jgi:hypothetical protein
MPISTKILRNPLLLVIFIIVLSEKQISQFLIGPETPVNTKNHKRVGYQVLNCIIDVQPGIESQVDPNTHIKSRHEYSEYGIYLIHHPLLIHSSNFGASKKKNKIKSNVGRGGSEAGSRKLNEKSNQRFSPGLQEAGVGLPTLEIEMKAKSYFNNRELSP